jgi:hypothetical protein
LDTVSSAATAATNTLCTKCLTYYPEGTEHACDTEKLAVVNMFRADPSEAPQEAAEAPATLPAPTVAPEAPVAPVKSDGGSTSYYDFPAGFTTLMDIIEFKQMSFGRGNIFKAAMRLGAKDSATEMYDLNKIIWFAERRKAELAKI